jgi:hypothetical protein
MTNAAPGAALPATSDDRTGHLTSTPAAPLPARENTPQLRDYQQTGVDQIRSHFAKWRLAGSLPVADRRRQNGGVQLYHCRGNG